MKTSKVYINGKILPADKPLVSVFDRGLLYGDGLFETMKAYDGRVFMLDEHIKRLKDGARFLKIPDYGLKGIEKIISQLIKANRLTKGEAYVRITLTRGIDRAGYKQIKTAKPTVIIIAKPLSSSKIKALQNKGITAITIKGHNPLRGIKSLNYLPNILASIEARKNKADEAIFVDDKNRILEGTSTNVFIVKNGVIKTPPGTVPFLCGLSPFPILPGITRKTVIEIARKMNIPVKETFFTIEELKNSDESFVTNSISEITPLVKVDSSRIGSGKRVSGTPGVITKVLQSSYKNLLIK